MISRFLFLFTFLLFVKLSAAQQHAAVQALADSAQFNKAKDLCSELVFREPHNVSLHILLGDLHMKLDDPYNAISAYDRAILLAPDNGYAYSKRGYAWYLMKNQKQARLDFINAAYYQPTAQNYLTLGKIEQQAGKLNEALKSYTLALKCDSSLKEIYRYRSEIYLFTQKYSLCLRDIDSALKETPFDAGLFIRRGTVLIAMKKSADAIKMFSRALRLNPGNATAYYGRGRAKFDMRDFKGAIHDFDTSLVYDPEFVLAYFNRAMAKLEVAGKSNDDACTDMRKAASLSYTEALEYIRRYCQ